MTLIQFTSNSKLSENSTTSPSGSAQSAATISQVVRLFNGLISNLNAIFQQLLKKVQLDSIVLQDIAIIGGDNIIPHTLGRTLTGWSVCRLTLPPGASFPPTFYDKQNTTTYDTSTYLVLTSDQVCTVSLIVF